jgi:hypothetical protein
MNKRQEVRDILNNLRRGDIGWVKAQDKICALLDIVRQSEQFYCIDESYHKIDRCKQQCDDCKRRVESMQ